MTLYKETILFVLDTPDCCGKSSNGWRLVSSTGISPPAGSLPAALIACDGSRTKKRFNARTVTEQEYHCPYCRSSPYREPPDTDSRLLFAPCRKRKPKTLKTNTGEISLLHFPQIVAQPLMWLMLITIAIGMCLMNGYSVVKGHAHSPHKEENRQRVFRTPPPVSSLNDDCSTTYFKNFFQSFFSRRYGFPDGLKGTTLLFSDLCVCKPYKVIEYKPPPLYFGQLLNSSVQGFIP